MSGILSYALIDQATISLCSFSTNLIAMRVLGLDEFGRAAYINVLILVSYGIINALVLQPYGIVSNAAPRLRRKLSSIAISVTGAASAVLVPVILLITSISIGATALECVLIAALSCVMSMQDAQRRVLINLQRNRETLVCSWLRYFPPLICVVVWHTWGSVVPLVEYLFLLLISAAVSLSIGCFFIAIEVRDWKSLERGMRLFSKQGVQLASSSLVQLALDNFSFLISGMALTQVQIGIWRSMQIIPAATNPILLSLEMIYPARIVSSYQANGQESGRRSVRSSLANVSLALILLTLCAFLFAWIYFDALFPGVDRQYAWIMLAYFGVSVGQVIKYFSSLQMRVEGRANEIFSATLQSAILILPASVVLIYLFGLAGAVASVAIATGLQSFMMFCAANRGRKST